MGIINQSKYPHRASSLVKNTAQQPVYVRHVCDQSIHISLYSNSTFQGGLYVRSEAMRFKLSFKRMKGLFKNVTGRVRCKERMTSAVAALEFRKGDSPSGWEERLKVRDGHGFGCLCLKSITEVVDAELPPRCADAFSLLACPTDAALSLTSLPWRLSIASKMSSSTPSFFLSISPFSSSSNLSP